MASFGRRVSLEDDVTQLSIKVAEQLASAKKYKVEVYLDSREHDIDLQAILRPVTTTKTLHAGDVWIMLNGKLFYVFERKRKDDLSHSISDGRNKEQQFKLKRMPLDSRRVCYIIESMPVKSGGWRGGGESAAGGSGWMKSRSAMMGAQVNMMIRERMSVFHTSSVEESAFFILKCIVKTFEFASQYTSELARFPVIDASFNPLASAVVRAQASSEDDDDKPAAVERKDGEDDDNGASLSPVDLEYATAFVPKIKKQAMCNARTYYLGCLTHLSGMTPAKAASIVAEFPTQVALVHHVTRTDLTRKQIIKHLADLTHVSPGSEGRLESVDNKDEDTSRHECKKKRKKGADKTTRRLGPVLATRLTSFLLGEELAVQPKKATGMAAEGDPPQKKKPKKSSSSSSKVSE